MRLLAVSDLHFHNYKISEVSKALNNVLSEQLPILIKKHNIDALLIAGDIFHVRGNIKPSIFNHVYKLMNSLAKTTHIFMIAGNHDEEFYNNSLDTTSVYTFNNIENCTVLHNEIVDYKGLKIGGISYINSAIELKEQINKISNKVDVILLHYGIDDFKLPDMPDYNLTLKDLPQDKWVLAGHYHNPVSNGKIVQVGAPVQHSFGDAGQDRGCWLIDTDRDKLEFIKLQYPAFVKINHRQVKEEIVKGNIVRLILQDTKRAMALKNDVINLGAVYVDVVIEKEFKKDETRAIEINDLRQMLYDYLTISQAYKGKEKEILAMFDKIKEMEI